MTIGGAPRPPTASEFTLLDGLNQILSTIHACDDAIEMTTGKVLGEQLGPVKTSDGLKNPQPSLIWYVENINEAAHRLNEKILHLQGRIG